MLEPDEECRTGETPQHAIAQVTYAQRCQMIRRCNAGLLAIADDPGLLTIAGDLLEQLAKIRAIKPK